MNFYRVERDGLGPYGNKTTPDILYVCEGILPWLMEHGHYFCTVEGAKDATADYFFGCESLESLEDYFSVAGLEQLIEIGFQIACYEVDPIYIIEGEGEISIRKEHLPTEKHIITYPHAVLSL